jgi:hypothetical protein
MIKSIDRITYVTECFKEAENTFSKFFNEEPLLRIKEEKSNNESLIYRFDNMNFEILKSSDSSKGERLFGFSLIAEDLNKISISIDYDETDKKEKIKDKYQLIKSYDLQQSENFKLSLNQYDESLPKYLSEKNIFALDHLVLTTNQSDFIVNLYEKELGIRLALDQFVEKWGGIMLFFRTGNATIEVIDNKVKGDDKFWGLAWKTKNIREKRKYLIDKGFNVSEVKEGRKKNTLVATVKFDQIKIPTLLVEHL